MPVLPGEVMLATDMDYDSIAKAGSMLGSGAVICMDESTCMVRALLRLSYFYYEESCGQCTPCREGTGWLYRMVDRIEHGRGAPEDLETSDFGERQHRRSHHLRAGGRGGAAGEELHQALPRGVRVSHRAQAVPRGRARLRLSSTRQTKMPVVNIEIDGQAVEVPANSTIMEAANRLGIYVPHFCYHKKLSIAANCRMCLVQVEKAPKPLPACATPVAEGMKVHTHSCAAIQAQKGVMEFLLYQPPARLPDMRSGWRMPAAGPGCRLWAARRATTSPSAWWPARRSVRWWRRRK